MLGPRITTSPRSPRRHRRAVVGVTHAHLDPEDRLPHRARLGRPLDVVERRHRRRLGQPVALEDAHAEARVDLLEQADRHRRAARARTGAGARRWRRRRSPCSSRVRRQRPVHRRHAAPQVDALGEHGLHTVAGSKRGSSTSVLPLCSRRFIWQTWPNEWNSGSVTARRPARSGCAGTAGRGRASCSRVEHQVEVRQLGALRLAGRARRVEDHRGVVGARGLGLDVAAHDGHQRGQRHRARDPRRRAGIPRHDDEVRAGADLVERRLAHRRHRQLRRPLETEVGGAPRIAQVERDLGRLEQHVQRHDGGAGLEDAEVDDREVRRSGTRARRDRRAERGERAGRDHAGDVE